MENSRAVWEQTLCHIGMYNDIMCRLFKQIWLKCLRQMQLSEEVIEFRKPFIRDTFDGHTENEIAV